jgi:hypothetical protein
MAWWCCEYSAGGWPRNCQCTLGLSRSEHLTTRRQDGRATFFLFGVLIWTLVHDYDETTNPYEPHSHF